MALTDFKTSGYRSIQDIWLKLKPVNVIIGPNGSGKSNMYRAIYLVACAATGQLARAIAEEGGVKSVLWAGDPSGRDAFKIAPSISLSVRVASFEYNLVFGVIPELMRKKPFSDPEIKKEDVFLLKDGHRIQLLKRRRAFVEAKDSEGKKLDYTMRVEPGESVLSGLRDPLRYPELYMLRQEILDWRFYHHFRTDPDSPLRRPQLCVTTPIMSHDGSDLVPAIATIQADEEGAVRFQERLADAFPDCEVATALGTRGTMKLLMKFPGMAKHFEASELSDGTLQYLCLLAALLSTRPASMIALNEPESSIHPGLYEPLAKLVVQASHQSQIWLTTHSRELSDYILDLSGYDPLELEKVEGETRLVGVGLGGYREKDDVSGSENNSDEASDDEP